MGKTILEKMLDAGFTADEIKKYMPADEQPDNKQPAGAGGETSSEEEGAADGARQGGASSANDGVKGWLEQIVHRMDEQLEEIKKAQQAMNVKVYDTDNPLEKQLTARDAFNQIYNPPMYFDDEKGEK